jgi:hypothetical protein
MASQQQLFPTATSRAYDRYSRDLSQAARGRGSWVHDPSFALGTDDMVYEKVRRDAVAAQLMTFRKHLVSGRGVILTPGGEDDASKQAAAIVEQILDQVGMFGEGRFNLAEAIFRGSAFAFIEGADEELQLEGQPPMSWWVPRKLKDVDRRRVRLRPVPDPEDPREVCLRWFLWSVSREQWEELEHPEWFVKHFYQKTEDTLNYGRGLLDAMHYYQQSKVRVLQEGLSAAERFGQGFIKAAVDSLRSGSSDETNDQIAKEYLSQIERHRARHAFVHAKEDEVSVLGGFGEGWQLIKELLSYLDNSLRTLVLGSNLPTAATGGGSFALAEIQENSTEALVQFDRDLMGETLTRDLVGLVWSLNVRNLRALGLGGARMPTLKVRQEKREDPQINAAVIQAALAAGVPLLREEVYDKLGFTLPQEGDELIEPPSQSAEPLPGGILGGLTNPPAPRELRSEHQIDLTPTITWNGNGNGNGHSGRWTTTPGA